MASGPFDPNGAVEFHLAEGVVRAGNDRVMVVPASLVEEMAKAGGVAVAVRAARAIGSSCGQRAALRLGGAEAARAASIDDVLSHLAGELAVSGMGLVHIERWGRAPVMVLAGCPVLDDAAVAGLVEGAITAVVDRPVGTCVIARDASAVRVLVSSASAVVRAREWIGAGMPWAQALQRLQTRGEG
jgi:antitoxin component of MazEF toxin-antitoxin module